MEINKETAWQLVEEHVADDGLRRHIRAVGAAMRWYAAHLDLDAAAQAYWHGVGILHDFDWEIHPDLNRHPIKGAEILRARSVDEETIRIILSHYTEGTGVEREKPIDFALLACDEITGLLIATALVRPSRDIREVGVSSVRRKWKNARFAAGVDRDHVTAVTADFSRVCFGGALTLWEHIANVLVAMQDAAVELGLDGSLAEV